MNWLLLIPAVKLNCWIPKVKSLLLGGFWLLWKGEDGCHSKRAKANFLMHRCCWDSGRRFIKRRLVHLGYYSRFPQAFPTNNKSTTIAAESLENDFVLRFSFSQIAYLMIREGSLKTKYFRKLSGVTRPPRTAYHPQGNRKVEGPNWLCWQPSLKVKRRKYVERFLGKVMHAYYVLYQEWRNQIFPLQFIIWPFITLSL